MSATEIFRELQTNKENFRCVDCGRSGAQWASVSHGVFICLECSGQHRNLGVHISFVRSITLDSWSASQLTLMGLGGNKRFKDFIQSYTFQPDASIQTKYCSKAAEYYRDLLKSEAENRRLTFPPPSAIEGMESCISVPVVKTRISTGEVQGNNESWWGGAKSVFGSAFEKAGEWASNAAVTVKDAKIVESIKSGANSVIEKSKVVGGNIVERVNSESLKNIGEKSLEVMSSMKRIAVNGVNMAYSKVAKEGGEEEELEEVKEREMVNLEEPEKYIYKGKYD
jgi:hypothetical protein